jgi:hypothetical protein
VTSNVSVAKINPIGEFEELESGISVIGVYRGSRYPAIIEEMTPVAEQLNF